MPDIKKRPASKRRYPDHYERLVPILLGIIIVAVVAILVVIVAIAARVLPGATY